MAEFIDLKAEQKDAFWKLYDEYETKRKELGKKRIAILEQYAANYGTMDEAATAKNINETAALGVETDKLIADLSEENPESRRCKSCRSVLSARSIFPQCYSCSDL